MHFFEILLILAYISVVFRDIKRGSKALWNVVEIYIKGGKKRKKRQKSAYVHLHSLINWHRNCMFFRRFSCFIIKICNFCAIYCVVGQTNPARKSSKNDN